jgi:hypothetical protein
LSIYVEVVEEMRIQVVRSSHRDAVDDAERYHLVLL